MVIRYVRINDVILKLFNFGIILWRGFIVNDVVFIINWLIGL